MTNNHKTSYKEEYKAKVNLDISRQDFVDEEITILQTEDYKRNSVKDIYDEQKAEYKSLVESKDPVTTEIPTLDKILSEFVSSEFDFKTLDEWDRIKKN